MYYFCSNALTFIGIRESEIRGETQHGNDDYRLEKRVSYPPRRSPVDLPGVELTENARQVLVRRYVRRGDDGNPVETVEEMFWRVAYHIAKAEESY